MFVLLADYLVRYRLAILALVAVVTGVAVVLLPGIRFDFTPEAIFAGDDDLVDYCEAFKETFGHEEGALVVVLEARGRHDVLHRSALDWQAKIAEGIATLEHVREVKTVATLLLPKMRVFGPPWVVPALLIKQFPVDEATEARVRRVLAQFEPIKGTMLSADNRVTAIIVSIEPEARDTATLRKVVQAVGGLLEAQPPPEDYCLRLTGIPALRVDVVDSLWAEQFLLVPVAGTLFFVVLWILFGRISGTLLPLVAVATGMIWTFAALAATDQSLNIISNILPVLLLIIGVSNCVHVVSRYADEYQQTPGDRVGAAKRAIAHITAPCMLAFLTTAIGFFSLTTARSQVLAALGHQAAMGLGLLFVSTIVVLGTLLPFFGPPRQGNPSRTLLPITWAVSTAGRVVVRHARLTLVCSVALVAAALWFARGVVIDSCNMETYDDDHPTARALHFMENRLSGLLPLEISLVTKEPGKFLEPETYRKVAQAERFAAQADAVLLTRSYVDLYQEIYAGFRRRDQLRGELPPLDEKGQSRIRFTDRIINRVPNALNLHAFLSADGTRARILLRVRDVGTRQTLAMIDRLEAKLAELFPAETGIEFALTGDAYLSAKTLDKFIRDLLYSLLGAAVVIFVLIGLLFRSLRVGLITIFPNLTPLVLTLGYMGLRGYPLNMANAVTFVISLGVAVDGTIHFLSRFCQEVKLDNDVPEAIHRAYLGTGRAIVIASLLIISGCSVLLLSDFVPTRRFAELTSFTMAGALVGDLLLLPALLVVFWKSGTRTGRRA